MKDYFSKVKRKPKEINPLRFYIVAGSVLLAGVIVLAMFYRLIFFASIVDMLHADCLYVDDAHSFHVSGDVIAPSDVAVTVHISQAQTACSEHDLIDRMLDANGGFEMNFRYSPSDAPLTVHFIAEGYTTCTFAYYGSDDLGVRFDAELGESWSITVTEMTLLPPRYIPHVKTFSC